MSTHISDATSGAHEEIGDFALTVNPFDIDETAEALALGLDMDEAQKIARAGRMREVIRSNDVTRWIGNQLQDLRELIG